MSGQTTTMWSDDDPMGRSLNDQDRAETLRIKKLQSKKGKLGLPKLLDARRLEYGVTDGAFKAQCVYDRIWLWQIPETAGETMGDKDAIFIPQTAQDRQLKEAPKGILVNAGLGALDALRSNGIDLGHIVYFVQNVSWRITVDRIQGKEYHCLILRAGDILASEDLALAIRKKKVNVHTVTSFGDDGLPTGHEHLLKDEKGNFWKPQTAIMDEDY